LLSRRLPSIVGEKFVFLGLAAYLISAALWLVVLSREELSFAYPLIGIGYIFVAILAYFLFGEALTILRLLGIILIVAGAYLILLRV
jgi:drug/metabolite transporter (DMT)-like permease